MAQNIPRKEHFQQAYDGKAPWDIGKPQPVFVEAAERITGSVLDIGCGTGENALFFAQRGHQTTGIDLVNVFATVQDARGRYVMNLQGDDFLLLEDGRPQKISYFSRDRLPLAVIIVMDTSLSMEGRNLEEAADSLMHSGLVLRDHVMGAVAAS